jgi:hypothetical protein
MSNVHRNPTHAEALLWSDVLLLTHLRSIAKFNPDYLESIENPIDGETLLSEDTPLTFDALSTYNFPLALASLVLRLISQPLKQKSMLTPFSGSLLGAALIVHGQ